MLKGKKVIIGISGGIAAYKSLFLIRMFRKAEAEVKVVVTENALWFVTRVSIESLSQNKVYDKVFGPENDYTTEHISLTDWADVFVVAPATANIIGKYANGIADDALSTSLMAFNKQVFIAPAMNCKMYENFAFQRNIEYLKNNGVRIIEPAEGYLACGYEGKGRMEEPEEIFAQVEKYFSDKKDLAGRKILVTAGPTYEEIDPVRFLGNHSTGKMGFAVANALADRGAEVTLITGPVNINIKNQSIRRINVVSAQQMYNVALQHFPEMDAAVLTAAVSDFRPVERQTQKIKRGSDKLVLELFPNKDILATLGKKKKTGQILVGFALETENETENAKSKLQKKNLDFIVLNSLNESGAGFGVETNKISIIDNKDQVLLFELKSKTLVAEDIVDKLVTYF
jgi:phosphopantothenoylcysteine decarboxylase / phosphopantothenate---cysteine ligase